MRVRLAAVLAVGFSLAEGCANPGGTVLTNELPASGNWSYFPVAGSGSPGLPLFLAGSLMMNGDSVSADFAIMTLTECEVSANSGLVLNGTVSDSKISMTSAAWQGTVFTVTGAVSSDGRIISGNWSGKGGCADGQSGLLDLKYIPPVTGTWTGVLGAAVAGVPAGNTSASETPSPEGLAGATVTFQLQQAATPVEAAFLLSGTMSISGSTCGFSSGTLVQNNPTVPFGPSSVTGPSWGAEVQMDDGSLVLAIATNDAISGQWIVVMNVVGGACDGAEAQATLTGP